MWFDRFIVPIVSLQLWACSDPHTAPLDRATTGGIHAMVSPPLADFSLSVDGIPIGRYHAAALIRDLLPGVHDVRMDVDAGECFGPGNPRQVKVVAGHVSEVMFGLLCPTGALVFDVSTTGDNAPQDYTAYAQWTIDFWCEWDSCQSAPVPANGSVTMQDLWTIAHRVTLMNLPKNCQSSGVEERVTVATGAPRHVAFNVVCT